MIMNKDVLKDCLQKGVVKVLFEKKDGTVREMICTLRSDYLPVTEEKGEKVARKENDEVLAVWDIDNAGWRSFRYDSIKSTTLQSIMVG